MSRDYVRGWALRDVWASGATLIVRVGVQRRLDLRCYWCGRVVQRRLYHGRYLRGRGYRERLGSSVYSSQWFACLASHTSRSDSPEETGVTTRRRGKEWRKKVGT
ncbi:hypothetical protein YC2023_018438 [Brassica napus]